MSNYNKNHINIYVDEDDEIEDLDEEEEEDDDNKTLNTYEQLENIKDKVFIDENPDFVKFKESVRQWLINDNEINALNLAIKERKKKKTEMTPFILSFMNRFKLNNLKTTIGTVKFNKTLCSVPINKTFLTKKLGIFFNNEKKGEEIATYILENREKVERMSIKRAKNKDEAI